MVYTELQSAVHAMIQRLEYSFTFNPTLLTIPKRKQQVAEILEEAEKYIWRIKEEMRFAIPVTESSASRPTAPGRRDIPSTFWMRSLIRRCARFFPK